MVTLEAPSTHAADDTFVSSLISEQIRGEILARP